MPLPPWQIKSSFSFPFMLQTAFLPTYKGAERPSAAQPRVCLRSSKHVSNVLISPKTHSTSSILANCVSFQLVRSPYFSPMQPRNAGFIHTPKTAKNNRTISNEVIRCGHSVSSGSFQQICFSSSSSSSRKCSFA